MTTVLDKELKRQVTLDGADYTVAIDPEGLRVTGKGKRRPEVELRWRDLLSGEAAMAVALNASVGARHAASVAKGGAASKPAGGSTRERKADAASKPLDEAFSKSKVAAATKGDGGAGRDPAGSASQRARSKPSR